MSPFALARLPNGGSRFAGGHWTHEINRCRPPVSSLNGGSQMPQFMRSRTAGAMLTAAIVALTASTAYIHLGLGGMLFTLNGLGYIGLAVLYIIGAAAPTAMIQRFSWFPRIALMGYAAVTIAGYLVIGPYFTLGWIAKGIEVVLITLVAVDILRVYGSPMAFVRTALDSVAPVLPSRFRPTAA
jgi:hypothetical protein